MFIVIGTTRVKRRKVRANARQLEEQLLYHKGSGGSYDVTITDYWDRVVCKHDSRYGSYRFSEGAGRVVCPFHEDVRPSMGIVHDPNTGVEVFNCFGCGKAGTVTYFHRLFSEQYKGEHHNNPTGYLVSLAKLYGVKLEAEITEELTEKSSIDFSKAPPYTLATHRENIRKVSGLYRSGKLSLDGLKAQLDQLTMRVLQAKIKKVEGSGGV